MRIERLNNNHAGAGSPGVSQSEAPTMHPSIRKLAQLAYSFPVYDRVIRYHLSAVDKPAVLSELRALTQAGRGRILAVDLANHEVVIGENTAARAVIGGRIVTIPE
jgi:hypothetical protein